MSEKARLGPAGMEVHEAASPPVTFEAFFEEARDGAVRSLVGRDAQPVPGTAHREM
jgi:hypothetical protein